MLGLYLTGIIVPLLLALGLAALVGNELKRFVIEVPELRTAEHLRRFKGMVARNMYAALGQIILFIIPWVCYFVGITRQVLVGGEVLIILVLSVANFIVGQRLKKTEDAVRALPVDEELKAERDRVVKTWEKKPFPDW